MRKSSRPGPIRTVLLGMALCLSQALSAAVVMPPVTVSVDGQTIGSIDWSEAVLNGQPRFVLDSFSASSSEYAIALSGIADPVFQNVGLRYSFSVIDFGLPSKFAFTYTVPFTGGLFCDCYSRGAAGIDMTLTDFAGDGLRIGITPNHLLKVWRLDDGAIGGAAAGHEGRYDPTGIAGKQYHYVSGGWALLGRAGMRAEFAFTLSGGGDSVDATGLISAGLVPVPEPSLVAMLVFGLGAALVLTFRGRMSRAKRLAVRS